MSGAQSWSVKGVDPEVREAVRKAAAREGLSLGEYLTRALHSQQGGGQPQQPPPNAPLARLRALRAAHNPFDDDDDHDWQVTTGPTDVKRSTDPTRMAQRMDAIERRTQLAITGLDRAVSTIDRSVLGLASRVDDAEEISRESADRIADALDQFRQAGETMAGRLEENEQETAAGREALDAARVELSDARERLEAQVAAAEDIARKAEAASDFLATELENREAALGHRLARFEDDAGDKIIACLTEARAFADDAARVAAQAAAAAVAELSALQERMAAQVSEAKAAMGHMVDHAVEEARSARSSLVSEIVRIDSEFVARDAVAEEIRQAQTALLARLEKAEQGSREATAGLRQAAGAAISDLRNSQLGLSARLKQVEEISGHAGETNFAEVKARQAEIVERLAELERRPAQSPSVEAIDALAAGQNEIVERVAELERRPQQSPVVEALAAFEKRLEEVAAHVGEDETARAKLNHVDGAVKALDSNLQRLAERLAETESTANTAIRTLEETVAGVAARADATREAADTEAVRAMLESRLDDMAKSVTQMVDDARIEFAGHMTTALGASEDENVDSALEDLNRRLAAAERRQAQTIEAISIEIKRMSETVDRRLRAVEGRHDSGDGAGSTALHEEIENLSKTLEARFEEIERREAAAFDRMGLEVGRISDRLEVRANAVEARSAQAIEQVGEQVARMAERFGQRQDTLQRELGERIIDSEERTGARVNEAVANMMQRLAEIDERSSEAVAPVQKAVSSVASRLEALEGGKQDDGATVQERLFSEFGSLETPQKAPAPSPMQEAQPVRAAPIAPPPAAVPEPVLDHHDDDIYFSDEEDLVAEPAQPEPAPAPEPPKLDSAAFGDRADDDIIDDAFFEDEAPPPPADDEPFWSPLESEASDSHDAALADIEQRMPDLPGAPAKSGRNDYLNAARRAAQAQSQPKTRAAEPGAPPQYSLRGSSRIVLWGAASAIALLIAGASWYMGAQKDHQRASAEPAEPMQNQFEPAAPAVAPSQAYDNGAALTPPQLDPATATGEGGVNGAEPASVAPPPASTPPAAEHGQQRISATPPHAARASVAAAPLAPRNVSIEQAAQRGDGVAQYELALQRLAAGQSADGVQLLRRSADAGVAMAQYRLAKLYERGEGVPADLTQARQWTERAAASGNKRAMHDLGVYFARGEGAPLDEAAAFRWFRQAAELGVADSQYNLGVLYQQGRGVGASPSEAEFWFLVAARQGDEDAAARAHALEAQLTPQQIEEARARAQAFRPRAASATANGEFGPRPWAAQVRS
jgi:localization factor PodJL